MKKILILFIGVLLTWNVVTAQNPTLNWRIINPRIEQIMQPTLKSFLCFEVQVSASSAGTYFDGMQVALTFNTSGLNGSTTLNRVIEKGPLAQGTYLSIDKYDVLPSWNAGLSRLLIGVVSKTDWAGLPPDPLYMNEVTTSYQTLVTVKIYISNKALIANLVYVPAAMNGQCTYRDPNDPEGDGIYGAQFYTSPFSYAAHDLANAYLGRIYSSYSGGQWSQAGNTVAGTGWTNWGVTENTFLFDGNGHITSASTSLVTSLRVDPTAVLTVDPGKALTVSGATIYINDPHGFVVGSDATGTGSVLFTNASPTITYGTGASADVQRYVTNTAAPGTFYAHLIGPTVNDPVFQTATGNKGVYLQSFNMAPNTYAYAYNGTSNTWVNQVPLLTQIRTAKGLMISTVDQTPHTMTMSGQLLNGAVTSETMQHSGGNFDLLSNPYPSALDFNLFQTANSANVLNYYQVWNPAGGNYDYYITTGGGTITKDIQVGQGFFVTTINASTAAFDNSMRLHSTAPFFKDAYASQLRLNLTGNGFTDAAFVYFKPEGTWSFDEQHDLGKWMSMHAEASELWTRDADNNQLSMNALPSLDNKTVSVPLDFKCGAEDTYTFTAENISSFEAGTEIYLEDKAVEGPWYDLVANPVYTFTAVPGTDERFVLHFFGPTGIDDPVVNGNIRIYGYGQDAYIVNRGKEVIEEYVAYDLMGRELHRGTLPNSTVNKVTIGDVAAYYIVKVITKSGNVYSEKVYIRK